MCVDACIGSTSTVVVNCRYHLVERTLQSHSLREAFFSHLSVRTWLNLVYNPGDADAFSISAPLLLHKRHAMPAPSIPVRDHDNWICQADTAAARKPPDMTFLACSTFCLSVCRLLQWQRPMTMMSNHWSDSLQADLFRIWSDPNWTDQIWSNLNGIEVNRIELNRLGTDHQPDLPMTGICNNRGRFDAWSGSMSRRRGQWRHLFGGRNEAQVEHSLVTCTHTNWRMESARDVWFVVAQHFISTQFSPPQEWPMRIWSRIQPPSRFQPGRYLCAPVSVHKLMEHFGRGTAQRDSILVIIIVTAAVVIVIAFTVARAIYAVPYRWTAPRIAHNIGACGRCLPELRAFMCALDFHNNAESIELRAFATTFPATSCGLFCPKQLPLLSSLRLSVCLSRRRLALAIARCCCQAEQRNPICSTCCQRDYA